MSDLNFSTNMRAHFAQLLEKEMCLNSRIWLVTGDLGYKLWDEVRAKHPDRFVNAGAAEQAMVDISVGLALSGQIPFVYSISPFLIFRPFESLRNYLNHERIPVKLIGSGRDCDYANEGFSHWAEEDREIMKLLPNIKAYWPNSLREISRLFPKMIQQNAPYYLNLRK